MPKGKKFGGRDWLPGQSGNPAGRTKIPKEIRDMKNLNQVEFVSLMNRFLNMDTRDLKDMHQTLSRSGKEMMIVSLVYMAARYGDPKHIDCILNRLIGKVKDQVEHSLPTPTIIKRLDGSEVELTAKKEEEK